MTNQVEMIGQIAITVSDVEASVAYYRDVLGLKFLFNAGPGLAFLSDGSIRIMLTTPQGSGAIGANSILYFKTTDIESTHAAIVARGSVSERPPQFVSKMPDHDLWLGFLRDPDGNLVGLMEEKRSGSDARTVA
ncbi:VOC family protein [Roseateles albus]|uniref:VOC family protein n=1 Tax=Roseateles albus TaxID=2987525 RepID=A0ABT5KLB5_9BURK|nr:VOC family protein [Roseateles albus]MDC8774304.1 VOC family protein [Roseateles albus]